MPLKHPYNFEREGQVTWEYLEKGIEINNPMTIKLKRAYDDPAASDGLRVLVDRLWPRGVSKEDAALDRWMKEIAPSDDLRRWFDHDPEQWDEFRRRYETELGDKDEEVAFLKDKGEEDTLTLVYAAKDTEHNNAVVLKDYLTR